MCCICGLSGRITTTANRLQMHHLGLYLLPAPDSSKDRSGSLPSWTNADTQNSSKPAQTSAHSIAQLICVTQAHMSSLRLRFVGHCFTHLPVVLPICTARVQCQSAVASSICPAQQASPSCPGFRTQVNAPSNGGHANTWAPHLLLGLRELLRSGSTAPTPKCLH